MATESVVVPAIDVDLTAVNRQRIPLSIDPFGQAGSQIAPALAPFRLAAVTRVYVGLQQVKANLDQINTALSATPLPSYIVGLLAQPDGSAGRNLQVQFDPASVGGTGPVSNVLTQDTGAFSLQMPNGATMPTRGLPLAVHGANETITVTIPVDRIAANGLVGTVPLTATLEPLPVSILAALSALVPTNVSGPQAPATSQAALPRVTLGEDKGTCVQSFAADETVDRFSFGVFFRLVEPQMSIVNQVVNIPIKSKELFLPLPQYGTTFPSASPPTASYADRVPVEQPLSADGFLDQIAGIDTTGRFTADETVPMAATLGLGYVLTMEQQWTFRGLGLGDLVYSLPLAPGEQTEVAVFERTDTSSVFESETLTESEAQRQQALSDTSTAATFNSAFQEAASGGSSFRTDSSSGSWGSTFIVASGGGGSSSSSGVSSEWLQGQRNSAQSAAESTHSAAENQASARRSAGRTGMRLASASESESVTTKTITNHNHTRALTMQYWEVLRTFDVTTVIDGLTLTCLIPMQIVRFMPPNQPQMLTDPSQVGSRVQVVARYANIAKHLDVLQQAVPRRFQYGLTLLEQLVGDPSADVDGQGATAEDVIQLELSGSFLSCETVSIVAVTSRNTRVGPVVLSPTTGQQPAVIPANTFVSRDDLLSWLLAQRQNSSSQMQGSLALPPSMNRTDVVGFEITRRWNTVSYTLASPAMSSLTFVDGQLGSSGIGLLQNVFDDPVANQRTTLSLSASDLEPILGGPRLSFFAASIEEFDANGNKLPARSNETYANDPLFGTVLPPQPYPVPALQIAPVLRYTEILEIEKVAQHVVRNTTLYSKAVWSSLSTDERAILLDGYTIGVPPDGVSDPSQLIPLLNCVQNKLLGFFGNSMIMPFMIPEGVAESMNIEPAQLQQGLLAYQQAAFVAPQSTIVLPTQGVLGEAILGHCPSAEKIDLTRFWNWQDSASDTAPAISPVTLPTTTPSIAAGLQAPNSLTTLPPLINNVLQAPAPDTSLLQALGADALGQQDFSSTLTGAAQLAPLMQNSQALANAARASALQTTSQLTGQAMATVGNIVGGLYGGNPNAGSSAAAAMKGGGASTGTDSKKSSKTTKTTKKKAAKKTPDAAGDGNGAAGDGNGAAGDDTANGG